MNHIRVAIAISHSSAVLVKDTLSIVSEFEFEFESGHTSVISEGATLPNLTSCLLDEYTGQKDLSSVDGLIKVLRIPN